ncbi:MAG: hypothetical protein KKB04_00005 [Candidatus Thermoplasmatota archaeon]|nr:hypothetical protein [Candidatus Thermoplasmatota archaeon]
MNRVSKGKGGTIDMPIGLKYVPPKVEALTERDILSAVRKSLIFTLRSTVG